MTPLANAASSGVERSCVPRMRAGGSQRFRRASARVTTEGPASNPPAAQPSVSMSLSRGLEGSVQWETRIVVSEPGPSRSSQTVVEGILFPRPPCPQARIS